MLLQKKALQKKALQKKALDFCLENQSYDRRQGKVPEFSKIHPFAAKKLENRCEGCEGTFSHTTANLAVRIQ